MSRTVALTGASGFIGQTIAQRLCQAGIRVRALVRGTKYIPSLDHSDISLIHGSLDKDESLEKLLDGCTGIVHCAGTIRGSRKEDFVPTNVAGVSRLLTVCLSQPNPPRFIHLSSLAAREPALSPYAWSKHEGENVIRQQAQSLSWIILRPPAVYGPLDTALLPLFQLAKQGIGLQLGPPKAKFSLIHVQDLADLVVDCLEEQRPNSTLYEVDDGTPGGYSWESVFRIINPGMKIRLSIPPKFLWLIGKSNEYLARGFGYAPLFTTGKVAELRHQNWVSNSQNAREQLKWTPQIPLEEGLRHLFASDSLNLSNRIKQ